jgi:hypothetical protein
MSHHEAFVAPEGYRTQSSDTSYEAERMLIDAWRRMAPWEKARRMTELMAAVDALALVGIATRHPHATARERQLRLAALRLDRETMVRVFGWDPAVHGY